MAAHLVCYKFMAAVFFILGAGEEFRDSLFYSLMSIMFSLCVAYVLSKVYPVIFFGVGSGFSKLKAKL